ncbi:MAG: DUF3572 domain-containing protein [Methyloligellaceae bacterium]
MNQGEAERIATQVISFLSQDDSILERFLALTGWTPAALRSEAGRSAFFTSVLEFLLSDESLLLAFSANSGTPPQAVTNAHSLLAKHTLL